MGNCNCNTSLEISQKNNKSSYNFSYALGQGGFGKVFKVTHKKTKEVYAMKVMKKNKILTKKSVVSVINEKKILTEVRNPFIINMILAFQDRESLYLVLEYMDGGDMRFHLNQGVEYTEEQTKFIACSIILGLEDIHKNKVLHRDLKPENLVFSSDGYIKITDFGIARYYKPDNKDQTSGTPGYMAPEVLLKKPHNYLVDYYALGVLLFEIIYGERPYLGKNRKEIKDKIIEKQKKLTQHDLPDETWTMESADFVNQLIQRSPQYRLGYNKLSDIKQHPWVRDFPWQRLKEKKLKSPWKPRLQEGQVGGSFVSNKQNPAEDEKDKQNLLSLKRNSVQELFAQFDYDPMGIVKKEHDGEESKANDTGIPMMTSQQTNYNSAREQQFSPTKHKSSHNQSRQLQEFQSIDESSEQILINQQKTLKMLQNQSIVNNGDEEQQNRLNPEEEQQLISKINKQYDQEDKKLINSDSQGLLQRQHRASRVSKASQQSRYDQTQQRELSIDVSQDSPLKKRF